MLCVGTRHAWTYTGDRSVWFTGSRENAPGGFDRALNNAIPSVAETRVELVQKSSENRP